MKIRRKRLYEDDAQPANGQQPQQPATGQQPAAQLPANGQPQQPANSQQPLQPANGQQPQQLQLGLQNQQLNLQLQQQQNPNMQKVLDILKKMENTYWIMSVNLPEEILKEIPDFKQGNATADPAIKLWNDFKLNPDEAKFNAFVDGFKNFGMPVDASGANASNGQQAVNAGLLAAYSFKQRLMENLANANLKKYYEIISSNYFDSLENDY